ncbi:UNVERIFIED_CONTAM: Trigger factor-like protein TIG, Chloroplastic [Sesamum latifolium]|uniref:peptidylprolyl isomerase n=1 Tax=Sesamum latifolium TaxID=2727402 RepID=A0AAW2TPS5_9LAMI
METCATSPARTFFKFNPSSSFSPFPSSLSFPNVYFLKTPLPHCSRKFSRFQCPTRGAKLTRFVASAAPATADDVVAEKLPADIQVTETPEPNSRVRLSVEVPAAVCDDCYRTVIKEFTKRSKVPGFRPGKNVPESILIGFVGKENVKKATIESILKRTLPHAMSSVSGRALEDSVRISTNSQRWKALILL